MDQLKPLSHFPPAGKRKNFTQLQLPTITINEDEKINSFQTCYRRKHKKVFSLYDKHNQIITNLKQKEQRESDYRALNEIKNRDLKLSFRAKRVDEEYMEKIKNEEFMKSKDKHQKRNHSWRECNEKTDFITKTHLNFNIKRKLSEVMLNSQVNFNHEKKNCGKLTQWAIYADGLIKNETSLGDRSTSLEADKKLYDDFQATMKDSVKFIMDQSNHTQNKVNSPIMEFKSFHFQAVKINKFFDIIINNVLRKVSYFDSKNNFLCEKNVANLIENEMNEYFNNNIISLKRKENQTTSLFFHGHDANKQIASIIKIINFDLKKKLLPIREHQERESGDDMQIKVDTNPKKDSESEEGNLEEGKDAGKADHNIEEKLLQGEKYTGNVKKLDRDETRKTIILANDIQNNIIHNESSFACHSYTNDKDKTPNENILSEIVNCVHPSTRTRSPTLQADQVKPLIQLGDWKNSLEEPIKISTGINTDNSSKPNISLSKRLKGKRNSMFPISYQNINKAISESQSKEKKEEGKFGNIPIVSTNISSVKSQDGCIINSVMNSSIKENEVVEVEVENNNTNTNENFSKTKINLPLHQEASKINTVQHKPGHRKTTSSISLRKNNIQKRLSSITAFGKLERHQSEIFNRKKIFKKNILSKKQSSKDFHVQEIIQEEKRNDTQDDTVAFHDQQNNDMNLQKPRINIEAVEPSTQINCIEAGESLDQITPIEEDEFPTLLNENRQFSKTLFTSGTLQSRRKTVEPNGNYATGKSKENQEEAKEIFESNDSGSKEEITTDKEKMIVPRQRRLSSTNYRINELLRLLKENRTVIASKSIIPALKKKSSSKLNSNAIINALGPDKKKSEVRSASKYYTSAFLRNSMSEKRKTIKTGTSMQQQKDFQIKLKGFRTNEEEDKDDTIEEQQKKKKKLLIHLDQDINYHLNRHELTEEEKRKYEDFREKIESLKRFDTNLYISTLEKNFKDIKDEIEGLENIRRVESRLNTFLSRLEEYRKLNKEFKSQQRSKIKMKDSKFTSK